ncbi:MAG: nucleoside diphosphate kinase regulator [Labilithrix sp.]|nr:nucleoside diphosphate kinase regulator [Labilithrix sp.]MCW5814926.1 nucleoside diphosphate kinase regulator [Labilithrix sp.]
MEALGETPITLTEPDVGRLGSLLCTRVGLAYRSEARRLRGELRRARVVRAMSVPPDVVTMNSTVCFEDVGAGASRSATLVYPWRAHERSTVNVLSPLGTVLLGLRVGDLVAWTLDDGAAKVLRVIALPYQPEAAGHWHL